jgi:4-hydroxybenzoyl-CoA thioesterase
MSSHSSQHYCLRIPVRFTHTDPAGFVFFPRYFEMLQAVIEDWFTHVIGVRYADLIVKRRLGTPTAATKCDFLLPSRLGDEIDMCATVEHVGRTSIRLRFAGSVGGEKRLEAVSTLVMISLEDGRPRPIPDDIRTRMMELLESA